MQGATPDSLLAFHDAGYREVVSRLGPGIVVDIGCGVGDETRRLIGPDRLVIGADYSAETMCAAAVEHATTDGLRFCAADGSALAVSDASIDYIVSSHIIEHFNNPVNHVAELARCLRPDGTAFVITPNAPADFENPFHVYLFEPAHLVSLLSLFFEEVTCLGLEGDDALHADFAARRASGDRLLKLDVLRLRRRMPRAAYVWTYERVLPIVYRLLGNSRTGIGSGLSEGSFFTSEHIDEHTPGLFAIARRPRARAKVNAE
ncbi:MAG TPA: class I SAM-dependent methyltransferase [Acidimicrobiia bacterium]|nr:class I SAM-dependent methyltransferase [Acidimicrobiia bacterium]